MLQFIFLTFSVPAWKASPYYLLSHTCIDQSWACRPVAAYWTQ